ncbi:carboxypeptidase-like regulatory domain-containing protein [Rubrolithibacter danxiaensis]|uniref:carboxypeptidase-like regulatory domain-containing protein n=1 Tax=Rubrolithibacter danxiaensis TaxID=3390805 RepID=UPI003BF77542
MKKLLLVLCFVLICAADLLAQQTTVQGIVFDKDTKQRITRVFIYNTRTDKGVFNNLKGEFSMKALKGDTLIAALEGYAVDTTTVKTENTVLFYLKRTSIRLKEVIVRDSLKSPQKKLEENQAAYNDIYRKGNSKDLLSVGPGGAGLSIDALFSLLSKEGKHARFLQEIIERDYREALIDYRYTKKLVSNTTGLKDKELEDFMSQYRPSYYFILEANDYALIKFIKESYQRYVANPGAYRLPSLKKAP